MELRHKNEMRENLTTPGQYDLAFYRRYNYEESKYFKINHYPSTHKSDFFRREYNDKEFLSPKIYHVTSRYEKIQTIKDSGIEYHSTNRIRGVKYSASDKYYTVTNMTKNRLDIISNVFYNTPIYWWVIAEANVIFDVFNDVYVGRTLRIPQLMSINDRYIK